MKVALLHYSAPPVVGGVESVMAHQARQFARAGHRVALVAGRGVQTDPHIAFVHLPLLDSQNPRVLDIKKGLDRGQIPPGYAALRDDIRQALLELLTGTDILIAHNVCSLNKNLGLTAALRSLVGAPGFPRLILWHHDLAGTTTRYADELHAGEPWELLTTAWPGVTQVAISALRQRELSELTGLSTESITVVPNGIDIARFHRLQPDTARLVARMRLLESELLLLLPVRITPRKNIELAIRALAEIRRHIPGAMLLVTGPLGPHNSKNKDYFGRLRQVRDELGLRDAAWFLADLREGFIPDEIIADFYRIADALFLPSFEEGFGLPLLEAALSRMPVFCSDIEPLRALGGDEATYFSPDEDPASVAAKVIGAMRDNPIYRAAVRVRAEYSWDQVYRRYLGPLLEQATAT